MGWRVQGQAVIAAAVAGPARLPNLGGGLVPRAIFGQTISGISYLEIRTVAGAGGAVGIVNLAEARFGIQSGETCGGDPRDRPVAPTFRQRFTIGPTPTVFAVHADEAVTIRILETVDEAIVRWSWTNEFGGGRRRLRLYQDFTAVAPPLPTVFQIPPGFDDIFFIDAVGGNIQWNVAGVLSTAYVPGLMARDPIGGSVLNSTLVLGRAWLEGDCK